MDRFATIESLRRGLARGDFSAVELTRFYLDQIAADESNAFISVDAEGALARAASADASDRAAPLSGIPLAHKDIFLTEGQRTTAGSRMLETFVAPFDSTVVTNLNQAGALVLGKTNMDEFAMGSSNENSYFGPVANPHDATKVPGGSSGGSAAAVAGGLVPAATGTDTGGSIRQPASFCGLTGLKPTYGRCSRFGMVAFASSLDQAGPITRTAADAALLLSVMAGHDPRDSTSADRHDVWLEQLQTAPLEQSEALRIGLPEEYLAEYEGGEFDELITALEKLGHTFVPISLPSTRAAIAAYYVIAGAEASTNLSRYDGVRFGHRCDQPESLEDLYQRSRSEGFGDEVKRRIFTGTYALSVGYYDAYYLKAQKIRRLIANDFATAFDQADVLLTPTTPGPAFDRAALASDPVAMYQQDAFTVPVSLAGLPALSMPCGIRGKLPIGAQLIAPPYREDAILKLANDYQQVTDWHLITPEVES